MQKEKALRAYNRREGHRNGGKGLCPFLMGKVKELREIALKPAIPLQFFFIQNGDIMVACVDHLFFSQLRVHFGNLRRETLMQEAISCWVSRIL